jgi:predicted Rossmann fold nucleotide-binding protein DprA/Smf involved in DNA uptake
MPSPSPVDEATLAAIFALESVPQMGPGKFRDLFRAGIRPMEVVSGRAELPGSGKRIIQLRDAIRRLDKEAHRDAEQRASRQLAASQRYGAAILTYESHLYPQILLGGNYPIPALFARGDVNVLSARHSVACVGSRHIREPYVRRPEDFAR